MSALYGSAILSAATDGDIGTVIRLARKAEGKTQAELGAACGYSQSVVSRIERGQRHTYDIRVLQRIAHVLGLPPQLLGLANTDGTPEPPVNRRDFLATAGAFAASTLLPPLQIAAETTAESLRIITASQRRLDGSIPSRDLAESVLAHLRLTRRAAIGPGRFDGEGDLAAAASEVAGFAGWLHWDMHDLGSARRYYDLAIRSAASSGNGVLTAYMTGSLAAFAAEQGDSSESLGLVASANQQLGPDRPPIAEAWLSAIAAAAHASIRDERATMVALDRSEAAAERVQEEEPPAWPWVFAFDHAKVAAHRLACAVRLGRVDAALQGARDAEALLAGSTKQAALWRLDHAMALLQAGHVDQAFAGAIEVLDSPAAQQSARVVDKARAMRRCYIDAAPPAAVRAFDERLRATRL